MPSVLSVSNADAMVASWPTVTPDAFSIVRTSERSCMNAVETAELEFELELEPESESSLESSPESSLELELELELDSEPELGESSDELLELEELELVEFSAV